MTTVLGIDLGKSLGYGVAGGTDLHAGCCQLFDAWWPLGRSAHILRRKFHDLIDEFRPDMIGVARPFVRYGRRGGGILDTPNNLIPQFGAFYLLHEVAEDHVLPMHVIQESAARSLLLGRDCPRESEAAKQAVWQACLDRGKRCPTKDASDALCIAIAVLEIHDPSCAHESTPLFAAAPKKAPRRRARKR